LADGLIVSNMCTVEFAAKAVKILHKAASTLAAPSLLRWCNTFPAFRALIAAKRSGSLRRPLPRCCQTIGCSGSGCLLRAAGFPKRISRLPLRA
jgi:hypothetical protein